MWDSHQYNFRYNNRNSYRDQQVNPGDISMKKFRTFSTGPVSATMRQFIMSLVVVTVFVVTGTSPMAFAQDGDVPDGVKVGVILPLSGAQASIGHLQKNSMTMAVEEVNRRGGIGGETLKLDIRDIGSQVTDINAVIDHFVKDKAYPVVLGGGSSRLIDAMARRCQYRKLPLISVTGSKDEISSRDYSYLFRVAPVRSGYAEAALEYAASVIVPKKVALWYEGSEYGSSMARTVREATSERGWALAWEGSFDAGTMNLEAQLEAIENSDPDAIFLCAFPPDDARLVTSLSERLEISGDNSTRIINLVPASSLAGSLASCGEKCSGLLMPSLWLPSSDSAAQRYYDTYLERFGSAPDYHGAQAYAAVRVAALALQRAATRTPEAVKDVLGSLGVTTPYGYVSFKDSDPYTNQNDPPSYLLRWTGDGFETVWPEVQ
jgi:branched-chain amino acid transport system substrate-binding protein